METRKIPTPDEINAMSPTQYKSYEARLRRMASRQDLILRKSPRRDPHALGYGTYMLIDAATNGVVARGLPDGYGLGLDDIERELRNDGVTA